MAHNTSPSIVWSYLLAELLHHIKGVFDVPYNNVFAWTDTTIVLSWLSGKARRFKVFIHYYFFPAQNRITFLEVVKDFTGVVNVQLVVHA